MAHRPGVSESRRFFIPLPRPLIVLGRTLAFLVQNAQVSHRTIVPRRRSLPIPLLSLWVISLHSVAILVQNAEVPHRSGIPESRRFPVPFPCLLVVLRYPMRAGVKIGHSTPRERCVAAE